MPTAATTFDDEFNSLSLHRTWQSGDKWQLIAPDSPDGRGGPAWGESGSQWWVNPYNPNTPINGLYGVSNGKLQLGILPTPSADQAYIDKQGGAHLPYVGALLNTSKTDYQRFGYYEISAAVNRVPGFDFHADTENVQLTGNWPPEIDLDIYTDASGVQYVKFQVATNSGYPSYTISSKSGFDPRSYHTYSWNWQSNYITFYIDGTQVWKTPNPGGVYQTQKEFLYIGTYAAYPIDINPNPKSLPAYASLDYVRLYQNKPSDPKPAVALTPKSGGSINDVRVGPPAIRIGPAATSPLPSITVQAGGQAVVTVDATTVHSQTSYGATISLTASGVAKVVLGTASDTMRFTNMSGINLTAGSGSEVVVANAGTNTFTAATGPLDVMGGSGADAYVFHAGDGNLTIRDFSLAKGDTLMVDKSLHALFAEDSDGHGGVIVSFGSRAGHIDLTGVASLSATSIHYV